MILSELFEDTKADLAVASEAHYVFDKVKEYLEKSKNQPNHGLNKVGDYFYLYLETVAGLDITDDMVLVFGPTNKTDRGRFGKFPKGHKFVKQGKPYGLHLNILLNPGDTTHLETRITGIFTTFAHEYTHYKDIKRDTRGDNSLVGKAEYEAGISDEDYYNSPEEFNAFYQAGATDLAKSVDRTDSMGTALKHEVFKNLDHFMDRWLKLYWDKGFLAELNPKYKRKFLRRATQLWTKLKDDHYEGI